MRWLAGLLLALPLTVQALPACWPKLPPQAARLTVSAPELGTIVYVTSSVGLVYGWACQAGDRWHKIVIGGPWTSFAPDWLYQADVAMRGTQAQRDALWNQHNPLASPIDARLKASHDAILAVLPGPPPAVTWRVLADPFRADGKRLVYTVVNGKRGPATSQYVDAGAPCDPVTTIAEFGPTYFLSVLGNPALVARCAK